MNPYRAGAGPGARAAAVAAGAARQQEAEAEQSYGAVAARLLRDNFLLTALELHTELVESGRELPQLREFFSNPGNFEQHVSVSVCGAPAPSAAPAPAPGSAMQRTASQGTLDSLDMARYSEDGMAERGGSGGEVAVLEFELRKARETINALRANLTQFADCDSSDTRGDFNKGTLKPHEKRALNFLINEYLLLQDFKLTSITFSDENPNQDFEDWDDVGLNMPRPCSLISLFRGESVTAKEATMDAGTDTDFVMIEAGCQTDADEESICVSCQTSFDEGTDWNHELLIQTEEIVLLKQQILALETEKHNFQKLYDAALASLNSLTSPTSETAGLDLRMPQEKLKSMKKGSSVERVSEQPLTLTATENHYGSNASTNSVTPDQFEMIDCEKNNGSIQKEGSNTSSFEPAAAALDSPGASPLPHGSITTLDETLSINDGGEWTRLPYEYSIDNNMTKDTWMDSSLPSELKSFLLSWCCEAPDITAGGGNDLLDELVNGDKPPTPHGLITLAADTLPRILPHTLVSRRCDAAALLAVVAHLLSHAPQQTQHAARRARLLQLLLTLLKKPDPSETRIISEAVCLIVKWGGSGEVLSCIAELLASRSTERRILASHVCLSIAPYVSIDLCTSLLLSLVVLMCESNEVEIRQLGLKAAVLVCPVAELKYGQLESIFFVMLRDPVEHIRSSCVAVFAPVLARSALLAGKFSSDLYSRIMAQLVKASNDREWKNIMQCLEIIKVLVPPTLVYVMNVQIVRDNLAEESSTSYQEVPLQNNKEMNMDLQCFMGNYMIQPKLMTVSMNKLINEKPDVRWPELTWFLDKVLKELVECAVNSKCLSNAPTYNSFISLISCCCETFGSNFTRLLVRPIFSEIIVDMEQKMEKLQAVSVERAVIAGIYLAGVLPCTEGSDGITAFLQRWIVCCGVYGLSVDVLAAPMRWLAERKEEVLVQCFQCLREIVASSRERTSGSAVRVYGASLLSELANCTELPEVCVDSQVVPAIVGLLYDEDVTVREKAIGALGSITRLSVIHDLPCLSRCWETLESVAESLNSTQQTDATESGVTSREVARTADALTLLVTPDTNAACAGLPMKVLVVLCGLCHRAPLTGDVLSSLIPGLQLAIHFTQPDAHFIQSTLLPALRRLDKIESPSLIQHKQAVDTLLASVAPATSTQLDLHAPHTPRVAAGNILAGSEAVGRRVTQIFQQTNMNLPNIFKKKS